MVAFQNSPAYSVTLEFDGWDCTASKTSLVAFTAVNQKGSSMLIDLIDVASERKDPNLLAVKSIAAINSCSIPLNIINAIVTDEAPNHKLARSIIIKETSRHIIEYRCMAHVRNLMIGQLSKYELIQPSLSNLATFVRVLLSNKPTLAEGVDRQKAVVPTR